MSVLVNAALMWSALFSANARITLNVRALTPVGQVTGVMYTVKFLKHYAQLF